MNRPSRRTLPLAQTIGAVGTLLDLHPRGVARALPPKTSPADALRGDWAKLGRDMRNAASKVREGGGA